MGTDKNGNEWTEESIKSSAYDALNGKEIIGDIESVASDSNYINWIVKIDADGDLYSSSDMYDLSNDQIVLSDEPSEFLYQLGYEINDDGDYVYNEEAHGPQSNMDAVYHIQHAYLAK